MAQKNAQYAVLWDLDGTMIDTGEPHYITWRDTLAEIGKPYTREDFQIDLWDEQLRCFGICFRQDAGS